MADPTIEAAGKRLDTGEPVTMEQAVALFRSDDLHGLGKLAGRIRRRWSGDDAYYVLNRHINYTNVCVETCMFCAFARQPGADGGWTWDLDTILARAEELAKLGADELHIVGGHNPELPYDYYLDMLRALHERHPTVALKAFTAAEIHFVAGHFGRTIEEVLVEFKEAGLAMLPGGGAEIFAPATRRKLGVSKSTAEEWLEVHRVAHRLGIPTNATMLYGHIESDEDKADHLLRLRALQAETGGFLAFVPLLFHPENSRLGKLPKPGGIAVLKHQAIARIVLDNIPHIKAYWPMLGTKLGQASLDFGADDVDGTVLEEHIYHMAGADSPQAVSESELRLLIEEAGRVPVRRDAFYNPVGASAPEPVPA